MKQRAVFASVLALLIAVSSSANPQDAPSSAWVGDVPIVESVGEIMARAAANPAPPPPSFSPRRRFQGTRSPGSQATAQPAAPAVAGPAIPQSIGTSFLAAQSSDSPFIPPDTMGSVGPSQIVVCVNGMIRVFDRLGNLDSTVLNVSTDTFFSSVRNGTSASDCRVRYDRDSQRWFVIMINTPTTNNRVMIAVSQGATITPTSLFSFFQFQQNLVTPTGDANLFADYPTLGIDKFALYIGTNMFTGSGSYKGSSGFVVQKNSLTSGGPIVATALRGLANSSAAGAYTPQGVDNDDPAATRGFFVGVDVSTASSTKMVAVRVLNPGSSSPAPSVDATLNITVPTFDLALGGVPAQGSTTVLDDVDNRLMMAQMKNGSLWTVHNIQVNASGSASSTGGRDGARWYEITGLMTASPAVRQSGTLFDSSASNPSSYFVPSIAASGQGHVALGSTVAGNNEHAEIALTGRLSGDPLGTLRLPPTIAQTSSTAYNVDTTDPAQRWGDFSFTCVDPNDNMTMWTFQEYCNATNSWGVRVLQLIAPPPAIPSAVSSTQIGQNQPSVNVTLSGTAVAGSGFYDPGAGFPGRLQITISGGVTVNSFSWVDPLTITLNLSTVGALLGPKDITVTNPDGQSKTGTGLFNVTTGAGEAICTVTPSGTATNASPIVFTLAFNEAVTGLSTSGISVTGGSAGTLTTINGATYTLPVTPSGQGAVTCRVNAGAAQALSDNQTNLASNLGSVTYDTIPPAAPAITSPADGTLTNNNKPTIAGTAEPNSTVTVKDGSTVIGSTVAGAGGTWSLVPIGTLADGVHPLSAIATDAAGNLSPASPTVTLAIDTQPPTCVVSGPASPTNQSPITFTITFSKSVTGLAAGSISVTNGTKGVLTGSGTTYSLPVTPAAQGTVTCQIAAGAAQDAAGNLSLISNIGSVTYDTTPPTAPGTPSGTPNPNNSGVFTVSWGAASDVSGSGVATYTVQRSQGAGVFVQVATGVTGLSLAQSGLGQGAYRYQVSAVDAAGNVGPWSPISAAVIVDTTSPHTTLVLTPPNPSSSTGATFVFASSKAGCSFQTKLDGAAAWTSNGTATAASLTGLAAGSHTFQVRAVDLAGNVDPAPPSYTWTINTSGGVTQTPDTILTGTPSSSTAQTTATFTFLSSEAGGTFDLQLDGGGWTSNGTSGTKTYTGLSTGTHTFMVRAVDTASNVDPTPASFTWTIVAAPVDATAPLLNSFNDVVSVTNWTLSGTDPLVAWAVDGTPAGAPGGPFHTAPSSLNYNNGTDYDTPGLPNSGTATSPAIAIGGVPGARLKFFCNYQTETAGTDHDVRFVQVSNDNFATLLVNEQLSTSPGSVLSGSCSAMGVWHEHVIPLSGLTGPIKVRFLFDTLDAALNNFAGWFVDDFEVSDLLVSGLAQVDAGSGAAVLPGRTSASIAVAGVISSDAVAGVTLQIEVEPVGTPFSGVPTATVTGTGPGTPLLLPVPSLPDGSYHWQARTVSAGVTSSWMSFGLNAETDPDFIIQPPQVTPTAGGGGGGKKGGCGMLGMEAILLLGLLRRRR